jgi:hypothetical protein
VTDEDGVFKISIDSRGPLEYGILNILVDPIDDEGHHVGDFVRVRALQFRDLAILIVTVIQMKFSSATESISFSWKVLGKRPESPVRYIMGV